MKKEEYHKNIERDAVAFCSFDVFCGTIFLKFAKNMLFIVKEFY